MRNQVIVYGVEFLGGIMAVITINGKPTNVCDCCAEELHEIDPENICMTCVDMGCNVND